MRQARRQPRYYSSAQSSVILCGLVLASCLSAAAGLAARYEDEDRLPGWKGETHVSAHEGPKFTVLSWEPRIFHAEGLLTQEESNHLLNAAAPRIQRSGVVDAESGGRAYSDIRTSSGMFFGRSEDPVIAAVENRIAEWTMVPVVNGEGIQVLRYKATQKYDPHFDYFFHKEGIANGGNRLLTVLMYLSDVEEGGETVFPNVKVPPTQTNDTYSKCAMDGLSVRARRGNAVAFWSLRTDGRLDPGALHGGCPVIRGVKWSATKWIHVARYALEGEQQMRVEHVVHVPPPPPAPPGCTDSEATCPQWATAGECESNASYMVGRLGAPGRCIWSCQRCDLGPARSFAPQ